MNHSMFCHVSIRNVLHFAMLLGLRSVLVQLSCLRWRDTSGESSTPCDWCCVILYIPCLHASHLDLIGHTDVHEFYPIIH